jgi:hypothetical protein
VTVQELVSRFPEIPADLHGEPHLARLAEVCGELLLVARKPTACSGQHEAANHYYLKLIGPLAIYGYGLSGRDKVLQQLQEILSRHEADPAGFAASLLPEDTAASEVRGPGCS